MGNVFLLRYDTEHDSAAEMAGFLEKLISVHREHEIPVTLFCKGRTLDQREDEFREFYREVKGDPLFDLQDHSYSHIGLGYEAGKEVAVLRADYEQSFAVHERLFEKRPIGVSICGTGGVDGKRLSGFDETDKGRDEFAMIAELGVRMINSCLMGIRESREFTNFDALGHPEIMGFPSGYSDTSWMYRRERGNPVEYVLAEIAQRSENDQHMPLMLHDWVAWNHAPDKELTHVKTIVDKARAEGYELKTHTQCLLEPDSWR